MSDENVQIVRRLYDAWLARDYEAVLSTYDPDIRLNPDPESWWVGVEEDYVGHEGVNRYMRGVYEAFTDYRPEVEQIIDVGEGRVLTLAVEHGTGRGSGAEVQSSKTAHLWTLKDGKAVQLDLFLDRDRAFQAVGTVPPSGNAELAAQGIAAINAAYAKDDIAPWRHHVEEFVDPELVLQGGGDVFTEGDWRGQEGAIGFVANQMEVLKEMWLRLDEFIEVDEDRFIAGIAFGGQARHTAIPVELHPFHVFTLRDGRILRWQIFRTRQEALEALGMAE